MEKDSSTSILTVSQVEASLPNLPPEDLRSKIRQKVSQQYDVVIVLDDDPTGTQTVHSMAVLTSWTVSDLEAELQKNPTCFYISTNTRSLPKEEVETLIFSLCTNIRTVSEKLGLNYLIISRGDSTLRGHYPHEVIQQEEGLGERSDMHILIPAFFEGGRYTVGDVHYIREADRLVPVGSTPFAQDSSFGYTHSNLKMWVEEKNNGEVRASEVISISIPAIRGDLSVLSEQLKQIPVESTVIVNAWSYGDLERFIWAFLNSGRSASFRTAASFVSSFLTLEPKDFLGHQELVESTQIGGLLIVGSHVPISSLQLEYLLQHSSIYGIEVNVSFLLAVDNPKKVLQNLLRELEDALKAGQDVVLYTSRKRIEGKSEEESLEIGAKISEWLVSLVESLETKPSFLVAKGGITSSDTAVKGLNVRRAWVLGQVLPGVPVWKLGPESKFPGISYIIFPGNVGQEDSLFQLLRILRAESESYNVAYS
ncbi:MAG: four-carbon acid sugar kinase family protein [Bacteroidota bacterium]